MRSFAVDDKGDLVFKNGDLVMIEGKDEQAQSIRMTFTTNINEWFLDLDFGLDLKAIRGKGKDKEGIKLTIAEAIYKDERIDSVDIESIELSKDRKLKVYGTVTNIDGNTISLDG